MPRLSRHDWLHAGLKLLREEGPAAMTIEALTARLAVTTGSFYHHFKNQAEFKAAVLEYWEHHETLDIIALAEAEQADARTVLRRILEISAETSGPDTQIRAWALQDAVARAAQERVDSQRLATGRRLLADILGDEEQAAVAVRLLYAIIIGFEQFFPPLSAEEHWQMIQEFYRLYGI